MKQLFLRFWLTALVALVSAASYAYDACIDGIYYNFSGSDATVTYCSTDNYENRYGYRNYEVTIPSTVIYEGKTYNVTSIGESAFRGCSVTVKIPSSVTEIGEGAFFSSSLTSIEIPSSVTEIGDYAFSNCTSLKTIVIPSSVTSIGHCMFWSCTQLQTIEIPSSVTSIGKSAFYGCSSLTSIEIPSNVTEIGAGAFFSCI